MRRDEHVENEATTLLLYAAGGGVPGRTSILADLPAAVAAGWAVPIELAQDDAFNVRWATGELSAQEEAEWVGKIEWNLCVPAGRLVLECGPEPSLPGEQAHAVACDVPGGDYRATVYAYLPGVNAMSCLRAAGHAEPLGQWFRRTRSEDSMPDWLACHLAESPGEDPAHEAQWQSFVLTEEFAQLQLRLQKTSTIDLLIHLAPLEPGVRCRNKRTRRPQPVATNARKPERFPLGLIAEGLAPPERPDFVWTPQAPSAAGLLDRVPDAAAAIDGGPAFLPLAQIHCLARMSTWCNPMVWGALLIEHSAGVTTADFNVRPSLYVGIENTSRGLMLTFKPKDKLSIPEELKAAEPPLARLRDGAALELVLGDYTGEKPCGDHRYRGEVRGGVWHVQTVYPPVRRDVLEEAAAFAASLDDGRIQARDAAEAEAILTMLTRVSAILEAVGTRAGRRSPRAPHPARPDWISLIRPMRKGNVITLGLNDVGELWNAARYVFAMRYGHVWRAWDWWDGMFPEDRPTGGVE